MVIRPSLGCPALNRENGGKTPPKALSPKGYGAFPLLLENRRKTPNPPLIWPFIGVFPLLTITIEGLHDLVPRRVSLNFGGDPRLDDMSVNKTASPGG